MPPRNPAFELSRYPSRRVPIPPFTKYLVLITILLLDLLTIIFSALSDEILEKRIVPGLEHKDGPWVTPKFDCRFPNQNVSAATSSFLLAGMITAAELFYNPRFYSRGAIFSGAIISWVLFYTMSGVVTTFRAIIYFLPYGWRPVPDGFDWDRDHYQDAFRVGIYSLCAVVALLGAMIVNCIYIIQFGMALKKEYEDEQRIVGDMVEADNQEDQEEEQVRRETDPFRYTSDGTPSYIS